MKWILKPAGYTALFLAALAGCGGCTTSRTQHLTESPLAERPAGPASSAPSGNEPAALRLTSHQQGDEPSQPLPPPERRDPESVRPPQPRLELNLSDLESLALANNPTLRRMQEEAAAQWARTGYVSKLPDPTISSMFFIPPMHFEPDRQLAEVQVMQMIPWIGRLKAELRQAHLEALVAENQYQAERLRVLADLRAAWFRLYVLGKQFAITEADKAQLQSLLRTANARVATGAGQPGDVLMSSVEFSRLQEQLLSYRGQMAATWAEINRLAGGSAPMPIAPPESIDARLPEWDHELLLTVAMGAQPELAAARLRIAATRWGIDVARLRRRPDITVSAGWMPMDAPGAMMADAGMDSWTLGISTNLPIYHRKYDAMVSEASRRHFAAHASEDEIAVRLSSELRGLWEQARVNHETVELYEKTILPQARQAFEADQQSLINNTVTFERVVQDYRTLLNLELGYHKALADLATTLARIRQTVGVDLLPSPEPQRP
jgi:outer membrane protein TolC